MDGHSTQSTKDQFLLPEHCVGKKNLKKKKILEIFLGPPDIVWNFNPGWSRDHPGLYGFSMYGDQKKFWKKNFEKKKFLSFPNGLTKRIKPIKIWYNLDHFDHCVLKNNQKKKKNQRIFFFFFFLFFDHNTLKIHTIPGDHVITRDWNSIP